MIDKFYILNLPIVIQKFTGRSIMFKILIAVTTIFVCSSYSLAGVGDWERDGTQDGKDVYKATAANCVEVITSKNGKVITRLKKNYNTGDRIVLNSDQGLGDC